MSLSNQCWVDAMSKNDHLQQGCDALYADNYVYDGEPLSPGMQGDIIRSLWRVFEHPVVGQSFFLLDMSWIRAWKLYVGYDGGEPLDTAMPGPMDNTSLLLNAADAVNPSMLDEEGVCKGRLRVGLVENHDYALVPPNVFSRLQQWYGGGPLIRRRGVRFGFLFTRNRVRVDLFPVTISVLLPPQEINPDTQNFTWVESERAIWREVRTRVSSFGGFPLSRTVMNVGHLLITPGLLTQSIAATGIRSDFSLAISVTSDMSLAGGSIAPRPIHRRGVRPGGDRRLNFCPHPAAPVITDCKACRKRNCGACGVTCFACNSHYCIPERSPSARRQNSGGGEAEHPVVRRCESCQNFFCAGCTRFTRVLVADKGCARDVNYCRGCSSGLSTMTCCNTRRLPCQCLDCEPGCPGVHTCVSCSKSQCRSCCLDGVYRSCFKCSASFCPSCEGMKSCSQCKSVFCDGCMTWDASDDGSVKCESCVLLQAHPETMPMSVAERAASHARHRSTAANGGHAVLKEIVSRAPGLSADDEPLLKICHVAHCTKEAQVVCTCCKIARYCTSKHMKRDLKRHRHQCRQWQAARRQRKHCAVCGVKSELLCDGCKGIYYCSRQHQRKDWLREGGHKMECEFPGLGAQSLRLL